ncbi:MAG: hypothetical protein ABI743_14380 [bacterium]
MTDLYRPAARPPWPVLVVVLLSIVALLGINWAGGHGPAKDRYLNQAIRQATHGAFDPSALATVTTLDTHRWRIKSFEGLEACPNLERLYINADSVDPWRTWADAQVPDAAPQKTDNRPTLPKLPKLKEVKVGAPGEGTEE